MNEKSANELYEIWKSRHSAETDIIEFLPYVLECKERDILNNTPWGKTQDWYNSLARIYRLKSSVKRFFYDNNGNMEARKALEYEMLRQYDLEYLGCTMKIESTMCCEHCSKLNRRLITVAEMLESLPLASPECTNKDGCNCRYTYVYPDGTPYYFPQSLREDEPGPDYYDLLTEI